MSLYLFGPRNKLRQGVNCLADSWYLDSFVMLVIVISGVALGLESPFTDPEGSFAQTLKVIDSISTAIFVMEIIIKVIAKGFLFCGDDSYLRNSWNIADFIIVSTSLISLIELPVDISVLKVMRMARLLRPIRLISRNENLKLSIQALFVSVPAILSLLVIVLLVMFIFGILGVNLLKGKSFYCDNSSLVGLSDKQTEDLILSRIDCLNYGGSWRRVHHNFDSISDSMLNMIVMT